MSSFLDQAQALLIGVGDYINPKISDLPATIRDVQSIASVLTDANCCGYSAGNVEILTSDKATASNIRSALKALASCDLDATIFVFFSGHGGRAFEHNTWTSYLCPHEIDPVDLPKTAISGSEFSALLSAIPARKLLVILDACHAAGAADLKAFDDTPMWKNGLSDEYYETLCQGSGRVIIASSKENQYSYVRSQNDLSLFTYHLCDALRGRAAVRGDGLIHVLDVFHYVNEAVQTDKSAQTPILKVKDLDLNFALALDCGGKSISGSTSSSPTAIAITSIREHIVKKPVLGAKAFSEFLTKRSEWAEMRNKVDLKRTDLEKIQEDLDLFGPDPAEKAARNRIIYFLLSLCLELERAEEM